MRQKRVYELIIIGLIGLNITMVAFFLAKPFFNDKPPTKSAKNIRTELTELLKLNDKQAQDFNDLADVHKHQMRKIEVKQARLLIPYFESLVDSTIHIDKVYLLNQLQKLESSKVELTYEHFKEIKKILNQDQMFDFKFFIDRVSKVLINK